MAADVVDAIPTPIALTARIATVYETPLVSPVMFNGDAVVPVVRARNVPELTWY
jgi:hypothetical protein